MDASQLELIIELLKVLVGIVSACAWPITVFVILFSYRTQIIRALGDLRKFRYDKFELEFVEKLTDVKQEFGDKVPLPDSTKAIREDSVEGYDRLKKLADISPRSAILEAWIDVERELVALSSRKGMEIAKGTPLIGVFRDLVKQGVLDETMFRKFKDLRDLRNIAAHDTDLKISTSSARTFIELTKTLSFYLAYK